MVTIRVIKTLLVAGQQGYDQVVRKRE